MSNRLVIIGAGGHGRVIADIALKCGYGDICFVDDRATGICLDFPVAGTCSELDLLNDGNTDFVIGIGSNQVRRSIAERWCLPWATLIHPSAQIGCHVSILQGTVIMAGAIVNPGTKIGCHCIINSGAVVEHDNILESCVHISPKAVLGGTVVIGSGTHIGIGAAVKNNISICENCTIGAGAVVVKNIKSSGIYVGVPAKQI